MIVAAPLVDWAALGKALGVAFVAILVVALCFGLLVRSADRRRWPLVAVSLLGCAAAAAFGVLAMLHK
jgi:hypothetical protein